MRTLLAIFLPLSSLLAGCASLPPMESSRLIERTTNAYATCRSFEDSGSIREVEVEGSETNVTFVTYQTQFVRGQAYRSELHAERKHGVGPYSLVYHWNGQSWSKYDSIDLYYGNKPVHMNVSDESVIGSGIALSFGLIPDVPRLLHIKEGYFSGFRLYDSAEVSVDRLRGRPVYRLKLRWEFWGDHETREYWIDPQKYAILKRRVLWIKDREDAIAKTSQESFHSPRMNTLSPKELIGFRPPDSP